MQARVMRLVDELGTDDYSRRRKAFGGLERLGERVRAIQAEESCAVLLVEHDVSFVMERCDRIAVLNLGEMIAVGSPKEIQSDAEVRTAYLG